MQSAVPSRGHQLLANPTAQLMLWTLAWVLTLAVATFGPSVVRGATSASWAAAALNLAAGVGWIVAHARFLRGIDELQRKIMQDALAVTLGVGWVGGFFYIVIEAADLVSRKVDVGLFSALLAGVYMIAIAAGNLRYR
jgi:hypothetical protein